MAIGGPFYSYVNVVGDQVVIENQTFFELRDRQDQSVKGYDAVKSIISIPLADLRVPAGTAKASNAKIESIAPYKEFEKLEELQRFLEPPTIK